MNSPPKDSTVRPSSLAEREATLRSPARLAAVQRTGLLDSAPEASFDALTRLAARLLKVPSSFIAIADVDRDFYKSFYGFDESLASTRQLTGQTFCHHTLARSSLLAIADTHADPAWSAVPTVRTLGVRAYAGVPLRLEGQTIGSFCAVDTQPHAWSDDELEVLREMAASAERELGLRAALIRAHTEAEHARSLARAREEIIAVVAHDLRTPLQVVQLCASILQRTGTTEHDTVAMRMLTAVDSMRRVTDELLSQGMLPESIASLRQPVNVATLLADAVRMMAPIAERSAIMVELGAVQDAPIVVDYAQLLRVLSNLIGNAIKYCPAGSRVRVSARCEAREVLLEVADNGPGMTHAEREHAFERGWQGAASLARGDGSGLGLSIVKSITEQHGGRIMLHSEPGAGSCFTVALPLEP